MPPSGTPTPPLSTRSVHLCLNEHIISSPPAPSPSPQPSPSPLPHRQLVLPPPCCCTASSGGADESRPMPLEGEMSSVVLPGGDDGHSRGALASTLGLFDSWSCRPLAAPPMSRSSLAPALRDDMRVSVAMRAAVRPPMVDSPSLLPCLSRGRRRCRGGRPLPSLPPPDSSLLLLWFSTIISLSVWVLPLPSLEPGAVVSSRSVLTAPRARCSMRIWKSRPSLSAFSTWSADSSRPSALTHLCASSSRAISSGDAVVAGGGWAASASAALDLREAPPDLPCLRRLGLALRDVLGSGRLLP
mmetsp:Transcript_3499/g.7944  ORF Transcript_3499/g.7944 Transcript_3499/m.7944 type:complete len:300 (-) Transcript_3499:610-1509(-)